MKNQLTVGPGKVITIRYSLTNGDGIVLHEASAKPVSYLHGSNILPPKLERSLETHKAGDVVRTRLLPDDAFGKRNTELVCSVPLGDFPPGEAIAPGRRIVGVDDEGAEVVFLVTGIEDGMVQLDGNHPMAGQTLIFEVEIQQVRVASAEELASGQASTA